MFKFITIRAVRQSLAYSSVLFNQFLIGLGWGWTAPTVVKLQSELQMTEAEVSWIVSVNEIGRICSPIVSAFIVDNIGRRYSLALVSVLNVLIWLSHVFVRHVYLLCVIRAVFGATNGLLDVVAPIYTTENCSAEFRGIAAAWVFIFFTVGKCLELLLATHLTYEMTATVNTLISISALSALYYCVETPQFLIMKGKCAEAQSNLEWLQADVQPDTVSRALKELELYVYKETEKRKSIRSSLSRAENVKSICAVFGIYLSSTATGGIAIGAYASRIFTSTGLLTWSYFIFLGEMVYFATIILIAPVINAKIKTRRVLIVCYAAMALSHVIISVLLYLHTRHHKIEFYPWLIFLAVVSCGILKSIAGPAQYVITGEILPLSVRALGGGVAVITAAASGFCVLKLFLPIAERFGIEINFLLYAFMAVTTSVLVYYSPCHKRPETDT